VVVIHAVTVGDALAAFAHAWEASAAFAAANHPALYDRGFHPTAVCGVVGAAIAAAVLFDADEEAAVDLALLRAAGLRAAFGSDGKALQVGFAASAGAQAARLALAGASAGGAVRDGFASAYGARVVLEGDGRAIEDNWIKAYPCCLQTHGAIEAALAARAAGDDLRGATVVVHPVSRQAAAIDIPRSGLEAKFSIAYCAALAFLRGAPSVDSFAALDDEALALTATLRVETDPGLGTSEAHVGAHRVAAALGSPARPMTPEQLAAKVTALGGTPLPTPASPMPNVDLLRLQP
jgi:2-methylcitrate dehydratase PrpD